MRTIAATGGATGIGFAIARCLTQRGDAVVLASRNRERLDVASARLEAEGAPGVAHSAAAKAGMLRSPSRWRGNRPGALRRTR